MQKVGRRVISHRRETFVLVNGQHDIVLVFQKFGNTLLRLVVGPHRAVDDESPVVARSRHLQSFVTNHGVPNISNLPAAFDIVALFTPHGWALRGWKVALTGASAGDVLVPVIVLLGMGIAFFVVGALLFRRRFS